MALRSDDKTPKGEIAKVLIWGLLSIAISVAAIGAVLGFTPGSNLLPDLLYVGAGTLAITLGMVVASWMVDGLRLFVLSRAMGGSVSYIESVRISAAGAFMSGVTPSDTGGEPLKIYYLHRDGMSIGQATATVTLVALLHTTTRFLLWLIMPLAAFLTGLSIELTSPIKVTLAMGLTIYLGFMALMIASTLWPDVVERLFAWLFNTSFVRSLAKADLLERVEKTVRRVAEDFRQAMITFRTKKVQVWFALALSMLYWVVVLSVPVVLARAMGCEAPAFEIFSLSMTVYLVMAYVPTPGASGGAEVGTALFFAPLLPAKMLGTFVIVWRAITYYFTLLVGGALFVIDTLGHSLRKIKLQSP